MKDSILEVLREVNGDADFESSSDFIEDGLMDSFEIVDLVSKLEDKFPVEIRGIDIVPDNFVNLEAIEKLLKKYLEEK